MAVIKHRVLWLEDDLDAGRVFSEELDRREFTVRMVASLLEFQSALHSPWDLVIFDLQIGGEEWSGLQALTSFRKYDHVTPTLVCTGRGSKREVRSAYAAGADGVIFKEDIATDLTEGVAKALSPEIRLRTILEFFPTPIAFLARRFLDASTSFERLRLAFDIFEVALKLAVVYSFAELQHVGVWPEDVRTFVEERILLVPSLGDWLSAYTLMAKQPADSPFHLARMTAELAKADRLLPELSRAANVRNSLFGHGITPTDQTCRAQLLDWWPLFFKFISRFSAFHTHHMITVESLRHTREGLIATSLRFQGASLIPLRDSFSCETPPYTGQLALKSPHVADPLCLHPWLRHAESNPAGFTIQFFDKVVATGHDGKGRRKAQADDEVEYLDIVTGEKVRSGRFSEFVLRR